MRCPVCRADNDSTPCRRCRADLVALFSLDSERDRLLAEAARAAAAGVGQRVVACAEAAQRLRRGSDALRWLALGFLLQGDFAQALAHQRQATAPERL